MQGILIVAGAAIAFMAIAFALFSLRILLVKDGSFRGTCANNNPMLQKQGATCGVCGRVAGEPCGEPEEAGKPATR